MWCTVSCGGVGGGGWQSMATTPQSLFIYSKKQDLCSSLLRQNYLFLGITLYSSSSASKYLVVKGTVQIFYKCEKPSYLVKYSCFPVSDSDAGWWMVGYQNTYIVSLDVDSMKTLEFKWGGWGNMQNKLK